MNLQKGFATILIIGVVVAIIAIGTGGYFYISKQGGERPAEDLTINGKTNAENKDKDINEMTVKEEPVTSESTVTPEPILTPKPAPTPPVAEKAPTPQSVCSRIFAPKYSTGPHYTGPLFDAHFHVPSLIDYTKVPESHGEFGLNSTTDPILDKDITLEKILCNFGKEKVRGAIGFSIGAGEFLTETLQMAASVKQRAVDKLNLFLMPIGFSVASLKNIETSNQGLFDGYGEIALYNPSLQGVTPSSKKMQDIYDVAEKHGLVVMMHPDMNQKGDIETALQNNPGVNFLLHGFESEDYVTDLMDKYPNVYFSIDSAVLYPMMGLFMSGPKEVFISRLEQDFNSILNDKLNKWKGRIKKHPDRFMWGTDRGMKWHYDEAISVLFEEFARSFIGKLDSSVQENFAYKNAERLLGKQ